MAINASICRNDDILFEFNTFRIMWELFAGYVKQTVCTRLFIKLNFALCSAELDFGFLCCCLLEIQRRIQLVFVICKLSGVELLHNIECFVSCIRPSQ